MDDGDRAIREVVADGPDVVEGIGRLLDHCAQRYAHPIWEEMRALDYVADTEAMEAWFVARLPLPQSVEVLWFALWDVTTGFDLRGSSDWSRDPADWDWWHNDDFHAGGYESHVLKRMHALARAVEDPDEVAETEGGPWELIDEVLTLGYVSLAAQQVVREHGADVLGPRDELALISGFPDAGSGFILGRLTPVGFEPGERRYRTAKGARRRAARRARVPEARAYELLWDESETDRWLPDNPLDGSGRPFEPEAFARGVRLEIDEELFVPLLRRGDPLELSVVPHHLIASERVGSLLGNLAPRDIQRIPARVESAPGRYEVLNTLSLFDCVDRERTRASVYVHGEGTKTGTLASLAALIEADGYPLSSYVIPSDLRLTTDGLAGARIFRVAGSETFPVVTHEVRVALEAAGVRGVDYRPVT